MQVAVPVVAVLTPDDFWPNRKKFADRLERRAMLFPANQLHVNDRWQQWRVQPDRADLQPQAGFVVVRVVVMSQWVQWWV